MRGKHYEMSSEFGLCIFPRKILVNLWIINHFPRFCFRFRRKIHVTLRGRTSRIFILRRINQILCFRFTKILRRKVLCGINHVPRFQFTRTLRWNLYILQVFTMKYITSYQPDPVYLSYDDSIWIPKPQTLSSLTYKLFTL